ncbi:MAG: RNA polymerase sigma-70 factor [Ferruginibacter sp.]
MLNQEEIRELQLKITENNDDQAFGQLYMAYIHNLQQFANSIIKNHELAEDIVSDVFLKIWQNRANLARIDNFKLYLYISTKNTALNYLSRHFRKEIVSLDEMSLNIPAVSYNPENLLITSEAVKKIEFSIQNLPLRCRLIFKLAKEDGLKYNDIAKLLNISVKTIDNQMAIALKKISTAISFEFKRDPGHLSKG